MSNVNSELDIAVFDQLLDGLADQASKPEMEPAAFFSKLSQVVQAILDPKWLAIIAAGPDSTPMLIHQSGEDVELPSDWLRSKAEFQKQSLLVSEIQADKPDSSWGRLLVQLKSDRPNAIQQNVADAISESVGEFIQRSSFNSQASAKEQEEQLLLFSLNAHSSLDEKIVGYQLANDSRLLLGCERVSVFAVRGRSAKLLAISSVATVEKRSQLIRNMKSMVDRAVKLRRPILSDQRPADSRLGAFLEAHLERSKLPFLFGIPIYSAIGNAKAGANESRTPVGFLVAESTNELDRVNFGRMISHVGMHAGTSLGNVERFSQIPFRRSLSRFGQLLSVAKMSKLAVALGLAALSVLALMMIKIDHRVRITGELRPEIERVVFSPHDGIVETVFASQGDAVRTNDALIEIQSSKLKMELERAGSDIKKLQQLKESKQIALNQVTSAGGDLTLEAQLASELSDLDFQIATALEQQRFFIKQMAELRIVSPIDGQVTTWQAKENLTKRPVRWGDPLLKVADLGGAWELVFRVPERRIGYILEKQASSSGPVEMDFFLDSNPAKKYRVPIVSIDQSAIHDQELGTVTLIRCIAPSDLLTKRQGAVVSGDVDCGKRSVWFVWTREMFDSVRRRFVL